MSSRILPGQTLDRRIRADLEGQIRSGAWRPGDRIPTEQALMAQYGCARMTVSKAVSALVAAGLVERRKKAGSFVALPRVQTAVLEIPDLPALITARGEHYHFQLLQRRLRPLNANDPEERALRSEGDVLEVVGVHFAGDVPFAAEHRVLNLTTVPEANELTFEDEPPGTWLLRHVPWTQARHRISAIAADAGRARLLAITRGQPCLRVERHTFRADEWITFVRLIFPGDRYDLTAAFWPDGRRDDETEWSN